MQTVLLTVVFVILLVALPYYMSRRAARQVVDIFRQHRALGAENAKTQTELGLDPPGLHKQLISFRDYKPRALKALISARVIKSTEEGKLYLSEEKLLNLKS